MVGLQEGLLRSGSAMAPAVAEAGLLRLFDPYMGVRVRAEHIAVDGAGAWAEYGPLFDGMTWSAARCRVLPSLCAALRGDPSLCTAARLPGHRCLHPPLTSRIPLTTSPLSALIASYQPYVSHLIRACFPSPNTRTHTHTRVCSLFCYRAYPVPPKARHGDSRP